MQAEAKIHPTTSSDSIPCSSVTIYPTKTEDSKGSKEGSAIKSGTDEKNTERLPNGQSQRGERSGWSKSSREAAKKSIKEKDAPHSTRRRSRRSHRDSRNRRSRHHRRHHSRRTHDEESDFDDGSSVLSSESYELCVCDGVGGGPSLATVATHFVLRRIHNTLTVSCGIENDVDIFGIGTKTKHTKAIVQRDPDDETEQMNFFTDVEETRSLYDEEDKSYVEQDRKQPISVASYHNAPKSGQNINIPRVLKSSLKKEKDQNANSASTGDHPRGRKMVKPLRSTFTESERLSI